MRIKIREGWEIPEREVTPEAVYLNRRQFLWGASAAALGIGGMFVPSAGARARKRDLAQELAALPPLVAPRNRIYTVERPITSARIAAGYNNFYEFTEIKDQVWKLAAELRSRPWEIEIKGLVQKPRKIDVDDLIRQMSLEERVYRQRCVEAWAMVIPWTGFPMKKFVEWCAPMPKARYVRMVSFFRPQQAYGQMTATHYPWPYFEGLTIEEATNDLAMIVVGMYGKMLPDQNGAPLRLISPWKYGFKSIKSIVRFEFTDKKPSTFWNALVPQEYDFWANVNPQVPHPRWSQATERVVETGERIPTRLYNGYEKYVTHLYR